MAALQGCQSGRAPAQDGGAPAAPRVRATPTPLEPLARVDPPPASDGGVDQEEDELYRPAPFAPRGGLPPAGALRLVLEGERARLLEPESADGGVLWGQARDGGAAALATSLPRASAVLVVPRPETMLVQAADWLAVLDDAGSEIFLGHPEQPLAYPVTLLDEAAFRRWLDELVAGKVRVIQRADGFEVQTNVGKLPGADRNGPTVPPRGGRMDLATLRRGLEKVRGRFSDAPDFCLVPSFGTELADVARALAANYGEGGAAVFPRACLVYPRPVAARDGPDAGVTSAAHRPP